MDIHKRFWAKVLFEPHGCWEWSGSKSGWGYGEFFKDGGAKAAHRVAYELSVGPIPEGHQIDHLCRNHGCVRPDHLEPVTQQENILRGEGTSARNAVKDRCPNGHPYSPENVFYESKPNGRQSRRCRICNSEKSHRRYLARTEGIVSRRHRSTRIGQA